MAPTLPRRADATPARRAAAVPPAGRDGDPTSTSGAPRRRFGAGALIALAALLLVVAGAVALATSGGDEPNTTAQREPAATQTPKATPEKTSTPEPTATATPEPTAEATAEPTQTPAPPEKKPKKQKKDKTGVAGDDPAALQLQAFQLNNAGDHQQALTYAQRAVELCQGSTELTCAYALFEYAKALRLTGNPEAAIAALEERKQRFPDNQPGAVEQELELARKAAGQT
jgi:tetratricopeptide (TPR) repeat protein